MISTHLEDSLKLCPSINISLSNSRFWLARYIQNLFLNCPRVEFHWVLLMACAALGFWIKGIFILHFGTFLTFDNSHWDVWYSIDAVASCKDLIFRMKLSCIGSTWACREQTRCLWATVFNSALSPTRADDGRTVSQCHNDFLSHNYIVLFT